MKQKNKKHKKSKKASVVKQIVLALVFFIGVGVLCLTLLVWLDSNKPNVEKARIDSSLKFGELYKDDYRVHNLEIEGLVGADSSRTDYIYVSAGSVDFDLASPGPGFITLTIKNLGELCRKMEVYADRNLLGSVYYKGNDSGFPTFFQLPYTPRSNITHVRLVAVGNPLGRVDECPTGHDLVEVDFE